METAEEYLDSVSDRLSEIIQNVEDADVKHELREAQQLVIGVRDRLREEC